jgi:glutamate carboxypeptidase
MPSTTTTVPPELVERNIQLLLELCSVSSASSDADGLYRMAEVLSRELEDLGLLPDVHADSGTDGGALPVLTAKGSDFQGHHTLLLGHLDTVLPAVPPETTNGTLVGTGALDMKGGLAALIGALQLLRERGEDLPGDLLLVAVPDEEIGGPVSVRTVRRFGEEAHTVLVLEPGAPGDGCETLVTGRRGLTVWRLDARGRAAHSGVAYWEGRSALAAAATWAGKVQQMAEPGDGPVVNVGRIVGGDSEFVSDVGEEHRFIGTTERLNIVADRCLVEGEIRYLGLADGDRVVAAMRHLAAEFGRTWDVDMRFEEVEHIPPVTVSASGQELADHLVASAKSAGWHLELEGNRGGVSFPNFLLDPSSATIIDGLGPVGGGMHTREEFLNLESLERRIALIAEALLYVRENRVS